MKLALAFALAATPAFASVESAVETQILPGYAAFAARTDQLAQAAVETCDRDALRPAWNEAFDAWLGVSHIRFGPVEEGGRAVAIAFWPDTRGATPQALSKLIEARDESIASPEGTAQLSVAARGLYALEYLLYDPQFETGGDYACRLTAALAGDLARIAANVDHEWRDGFAATVLSAGEPGNAVFLGPDEAAQAMFTSLMTGLEFTADQRLGRPLGSFERPRPTRAETWRSGRSLRNVQLSLEALHDFALSLADAPLPLTEAAFARATELAAQLDDPVFAGVAEPQERLKVEILQQAVRAARDAAGAELGAALGVGTGFNSADGD